MLLLREDYSFIYPRLYVARYSFIQLSELWQRGVKEIVKASKRQQDDSNPGSLDCEPDVLTVTLRRRTHVIGAHRGDDSIDSRDLYFGNS